MALITSDLFNQAAAAAALDRELDRRRAARRAAAREAARAAVVTSTLPAVPLQLYSSCRRKSSLLYSCGWPPFSLQTGKPKPRLVTAASVEFGVLADKTSQATGEGRSKPSHQNRRQQAEEAAAEEAEGRWAEKAKRLARLDERFGGDERHGGGDDGDEPPPPMEWCAGRAFSQHQR